MDFRHPSKFRNLTAICTKREAWYDATPSQHLREADGVATTTSFLAYPASANNGAAVAIVALDECGKASKTVTPLLRGHSAPVQALSFSYYQPNVLATGAADESVRIWKIPSEGLTADLATAEACFEMGRNVNHVAFHPSAATIVAVATTKSIQFLDLDAPTQMLEVSHNYADVITSMQWNYDGSALLTSCKDKTVQLLDPRSASSVFQIEAHSGRKATRVLWCGRQERFVTAGFNNMQEREIKLWDPRSTASAIARIRIDSSTGILMPFFDTDTNLLFVGGKGDTGLRYYEVDSSKTQCLQSIGHATIGEPSVGMGLLPKSECSGKACEVARLVNLTTKTIEPVSFQVPRREAREHFQADLYPDTRSSSPAISGTEWLAGENAVPKLKKVSLSFFRESQKQQANLQSASEGKSVSGRDPVKAVEWNTGSGWGNGASSEKLDVVATVEVPVPKEEEAASTQPKGISEKAQRLGKLQKNTFRYIQGKPAQRSDIYFNLQADVTSSLVAPIIAANEMYWAAPVQGTGGAPVYVSPLSKTGKVDVGPAVLNGQRLPVIDMSFNPFNPNILATGSDDSTVMLWSISEGGLTQSVGADAAMSVLSGHSRGIRTLNFHPAADNVLATTSTDLTMKFWDISTSSEMISLENKYEDVVLNADFNYDGSLIASTSRDRVLHVVDPRSCKSVALSCGHKGSKGQFVKWCSRDQSPYLFTVGFSRTSDRQFCLWDSRNLLDPLTTTNIDSSGSLLYPLYDSSSGLMFLAGKGDRTIMVYEINTSSGAPQALACDSFSGLSSPICGIAMLPKRECDVAEIELDKFLVLSQNSVDPLSFVLPRSKNLKSYFQDDLYGPADSGVAGIDGSSWFAGGNHDRVQHSLMPEGMVPLSEKPAAKPVVPKVVGFREEKLKQEEEARRQEQEFLRLQALADQRAVHHPNLSMGQEDGYANEDSDDDWDD